MRHVPRAPLLWALLLAGLPSAAAGQQGSVQVGAAAHVAQGDKIRLAGQDPLEPEITFSWLRPNTAGGTLQIDLRGITRDNLPHVGRAFVSLRDVKHRGVTYTFEAGDSFFSPSSGDYQFRNLFTPAVTFAGASVTATTPSTRIALMAGRATASRNYFGSDPDTLDQDLVIGRGSHRLNDRLEMSARISRIRTRDLKEFQFSVAASDQAGGGARYLLTPSIHLVADGSVVRYRRRDRTEYDTDGSVLAGASLLLSRGWVQVNASRFSPGELPVLSQPLADRQTLYAAAEYDVVPRLRLFGGWEAFASNLYEHVGTSTSAGEGARAFAGVRVPLGPQTSASVRVEDGARRSRLLGAGLTRVSDTGVVSGELQSTFGSVSAFGRFARRDNVESDYAEGTYTQREGAGLLFANLTRRVQIFGSVSGIHNERQTGGGHTFWQYGGGLQTQVTDRGLYVRGEALMSRNLDLLLDRMVPQHTFGFGLNGQIAPYTTLSVNLYADHLLRGDPEADGSWITRSSLRIVRTFPSSSHRAVSRVSTDMARHGGTGSIVGLVFSDWNANGVREPDEEALENIPIRLANLGHASTSGVGEFSFVNVPIGLQQVGIDMMSLPVDYDAPKAPSVQLDLRRGDTHRLAFGLVPMGTIGGRVLKDVNGNGTTDDADTPLDGAVVVLDGGARSEQMRRGEFRFDAVRSGARRLTVLQESMPEGATVLGSATVEVTIGRRALEQTAVFLVRIQERPEVRRVFTPPAAAPPARPSAPARANTATPPPTPPAKPLSPRAPAPAARSAQFSVQVAAVNDPSRAADLVLDLRNAGYTAYLVEPPASDPDAPYKIRVGLYDSRAEADKAAAALEKTRGRKVWVVRER